jgi:hypothetical protein
MRTTMIVLGIVLTAGAASADGGYVDVSFGGATYHGDFAPTRGSLRGLFGAGFIHHGYAVELFGAGLDPNFGYIDCYGIECAYAAQPVDGFGVVGADVKRAFSLIHLRNAPRLRLEMFLHGGPRYFWGTDNLDKYAGPGIGGGAGLELNLAIVSYYIDFGVDTAVLHRDASPEVAGSLPYIAVGCRMGWM